MAREFTMPKLGLTMTEGTIREWLVPAGTKVLTGDPVLVIETDKVETEIQARADGVWQPSAVIGETYECGALIGWLLDDDEQPIQESASAPPSAASQAAFTTALSAPAVVSTSESSTFSAGETSVALADVASRGEGGRILASPRARAAARVGAVELAQITGTGPGGRILSEDVEAFAARPVAPPVVEDPVAPMLALVEEPAASDAESVELTLALVEETVDVVIPAGDPAVREAMLFERMSGPPVVVPPLPPSISEVLSSSDLMGEEAKVLASSTSSSMLPATGGARMLADLLGIDLDDVAAATQGDQVTREDVAVWVRARLADRRDSLEVTEGTSTDDTSTDDTSTDDTSVEQPVVASLQEPTSVIPLRGMRAIIAERMHSSLAEMAQLTLGVDVDMTAINAERDRRGEADLTVPGYTAWVVAAAARALGDHRYVNSQITPAGVALLPDIHIGVAVAVDNGLIVPVIHDANGLAVAEIHGQVADLATRARTSKLTFAELEGGTFSVTALGMYGVNMFTPVINPPNTAILGVGQLRTDTAWKDGQPGPKTVMTLSLTWDHRAFDGAPAAEFAQTIVRYLENPDQLD